MTDKKRRIIAFLADVGFKVCLVSNIALAVYLLFKHWK